VNKNAYENKSIWIANGAKLIFNGEREVNGSASEESDGEIREKQDSLGSCGLLTSPLQRSSSSQWSPPPLQL